jgi:uncharacterized protein YjeT (DUF2065 family)
VEWFFALGVLFIAVGLPLLLFPDKYIAWRKRHSRTGEFPQPESLAQAIGCAWFFLGVLVVWAVLTKH